MATDINRGNQTVSFDYREPAKAKNFNDLLHGLLPHGIYSGGKLSKIDNATVQVSELICFIKSGTHTEKVEPHMNPDDVSVRVRAFSTQTVAMPDPARPYIVLRFSWADAERNYMDYLSVGFSDDPSNTDTSLIMPYDLVVGKALFDADGITGQFDLTRRSRVFFQESEDVFRELQVQSSEVSAKKVFVTSGMINTSKGRILVGGGDFPKSDGTILDSEGTVLSGTDIPDTPSGAGRKDIVFIDDEGRIFFQLGEATATPVPPRYRNRKVIAEIHRGAGRTDVKGTDIMPVDLGRQGTIAAKDFLLEDTNSYFAVANRNVEEAIRVLYESFASILAAEGSSSDDSVKDFHIDFGTGEGQVSAIDIPIADAASVISGNKNLEDALQEIIGEGRDAETIKGNADAISQNTADLSAHRDLDAGSTEVHGFSIVSEIL